MTDARRQADRGRPWRPLVLLLGIAALTTVAVVAMVGLTRSGGSSIGIGRPVPNVAGTTLDGQAFDLATLRGRPVIVNFWGPSCEPCKREFPLLAAMATAHAGEGLVIVGVLMDDPVEPARAYALEHGGTWPTVIDPDGSIKRAYNVVARPQTYFVDRTGVLRSIQVGELLESDFERQYAAIAGDR